MDLSFAEHCTVYFKLTGKHFTNDTKNWEYWIFPFQDNDKCVILPFQDKITHFRVYCTKTCQKKFNQLDSPKRSSKNE